MWYERQTRYFVNLKLVSETGILFVCLKSIPQERHKKIEKVRRRAIKLVPSLRNKSYTDRLKLLKLSSLEERRSRGDLIQYFKFSNHLNNIDWFHPTAHTPNYNHTGSTRR